MAIILEDCHGYALPQNQKVCSAIWKIKTLLEQQSFDRKKKPENLPVVVIMKVRVVLQEEMSAGVI